VAAVDESNNAIKLMDAVTGDVKQTLSGHTAEITSVAFSRDGRTLASGSFDKSVKLWDPGTGDDTLTSLSFSPDGKLIAAGSYDNSVRMWETATAQPKMTLKGHSDVVETVAFSPDGKLLASGSADKSVKLWE
jgi:WD40 repeat protein